jgi:hypothetical protein
MTAALTFSRRKMFSKVRVTDEVPAPDEPVMAMMGCLVGMMGLLDAGILGLSPSAPLNRLPVRRKSGAGASRLTGSWW